MLTLFGWDGRPLRFESAGKPAHSKRFAMEVSRFGFLALAREKQVPG